MEGLSWSASPHPEAFKRQSATTETLNRLASFIARAESKQGLEKVFRVLPQQRRLQEDATLPLACHECGESFPCSTELLKHQDVHHALPKPHRCCSCGMTFSLRSSLQLHNCDVSPQLFQAPNSPTYATSLIPRLSADVCFSQPHGLDINPYACAPCGKGFVLKQALLHHQQAGCDKTASPPRSDDLASPTQDSPLASEDDSSSASSLYVPDGESVCKFCSRTFSDEAAFRRHNRTQHSDEPHAASWEGLNGEGRTRAGARPVKDVFSCRSCDMVFSSTAELSQHRKEMHRRGMKMEEDAVAPVILKLRKKTSNTYTCQICSQVFFHHLSLWAHKKKHPAPGFGASHSNNKSLPLNDATKDCTFVENPNTHKNFVPGKTLVQESTLTKAKMSPSKLHKPQRFTASFEPLNSADCADDSDEEEVEFPCPSCPEVFSRHSDLKAHAELHQSAVRRSRCSVCASEMDSLKWPGSKRLRLYHCILCQTGFSALEPFLSHCQTHLKAKVEEEGLTQASCPPDT